MVRLVGKKEKTGKTKLMNVTIIIIILIIILINDLVINKTILFFVLTINRILFNRSNVKSKSPKYNIYIYMLDNQFYRTF